MDAEQRARLRLSAAQADAHGHIDVARWYRCWAETGRQIGPKPEVDQRGSLGKFAPIS